MAEMNPYYAHPSPVGDVFDVATWSPGKNFTMGATGLILAVLLGAAAACVWDPALMKEYLPDLADNLARENRKLTKEYSWAIPAIVFGMGALAYLFLAAGVTFVTDSMRGDCYFRAGPGGMSLRLPNGVSLAKLGFGSKVLVLHLPWGQIERWSITQHKRFGSMSANAGNLNAHIDIKLRDGRSYHFSLDTFREPARIIHSRIEEAQQTTTAFPTTAPSSASLGSAVPSVDHDVHTFAGERKQNAVTSSLVELLRKNVNGGAVVFSDHATGRFVQFVHLHGALLLDLPMQSLRADEKTRAAEFFRGLSEGGESDFGQSPGAGGAPAKVAMAAVATSRSYQVNFGQDADRAAAVALDLFHDVLGVPSDFELEIENF